VKSKDSKIKNIVFLHPFLVRLGGSEKLMIEGVKYFKQLGAKTHVLTFKFDPEEFRDFDLLRNADVQVIGGGLLYPGSYSGRGILSPFLALALRRKIGKIKPDIIISQEWVGCVYLYLATLFSPFNYVTNIYETMFRSDTNPLRYAHIHRKVFDELRESTPGGKEFISTEKPRRNLIWNMLVELMAIVARRAIRKASKIFVLSNQMKHEVSKLYDREATVIRGGIPREILTYEPKQDIKQKLGLSNRRVILNVNRLIPRKRVDLLIKAFGKLSNRFKDVVLVIGGAGPEEGNLKNLAKDLGIADRVKFVGFIKEGELWDYYAGCDVFAHLNWADFALAPLEALALQKKVVWTTEIETDEFLAQNKHIFVAEPTVNDAARALEEALSTEVTEKNDLSSYASDVYFESLSKELLPLLG
jgi:glycosyltransferase involved in cell wall biosynthesis